MNLNDLLEKQGLDPRLVLVMRHRPTEPQLHRVFPWLAAEKPEIFNAYQQTQGPKVEAAMQTLEHQGHVASFISYGPGKALFIGLYSIQGSHAISSAQYWEIPAYREMSAFGLIGPKRDELLWFDMTRLDAYSEWSGRLIISWPPPERSWWRRAHKNDMRVLAIREESALAQAVPDWTDIVLRWNELAVLPQSWRSALSHWRGIYFIRDETDGLSYVGSASGSDNLLGRWMNYAASGDGGNQLLKTRDKSRFTFSILQRVSPDLEIQEVVKLENSWKERLHTKHPDGLNAN